MKHEKPMNQGPLSPPRLLVVDDDNDLRGFLEDFLLEEGYAVDTAATLDEALTLLDLRLYHLVVTDLLTHSVAAPLSTALTILAHARPTPVVALTGWNIGAEEVKRAGLLRLIRKPFDLGDLLKTLEACIKVTLTPAQQRQEATALRFYMQLTDGDSEGLRSLCTDDLCVYGTGTTGATGATGTPHNAPPSAIRGQKAGRVYLVERLAAYPHARMDDHITFPQPGGLALRYLLSWQPTEDTEERTRVSSAAYLQFRGARISQITLTAPERFTAAIARLRPALSETEDCQD